MVKTLKLNERLIPGGGDGTLNVAFWVTAVMCQPFLRLPPRFGQPRTVIRPFAPLSLAITQGAGQGQIHKHRLQTQRCALTRQRLLAAEGGKGAAVAIG